MSEQLKAFLAAYLAWVDAGAPHKEPFSRRYGLCSNLYDWSLRLDYDGREALEKELDQLFALEGLDECHPFGGDKYLEARESETQHLNMDRINWVRLKVAQYEVV